MGLSLIDGPVNMNVASTKMLDGLPVTLTVYGPGAAVFETTKLLPLKLPPTELDRVQLDTPIIEPESEQVVSPDCTVPLTMMV